MTAAGAARPVDSSAYSGADRFAALWQRCVSSPPSPDAASVYERVTAELGAPARRFHNLGHIGDCIRRVDEVAGLLQAPDAVELALWFHDVIVEPGSADNEERSAELFITLAAGAAPAFRRRVCRLILATRHGTHMQRGDRAYMVDIDLAGLGAPWDAFMRHGDLLRMEFATQSDDDYYPRQITFFERLLQRPWLYATAYFRSTYEHAARSNLQRLLALRQAQGYTGA